MSSPDKSISIGIDVDNNQANASLAETKKKLESLVHSDSPMTGAELQKNTGVLIAYEEATSALVVELSTATAKTNEFRVANEAEFKILEKAHEALGEKIRLMQAAGGEVSGLVAKQSALSEALSTERALQIATAMETRKANNAKLQSAIADNAAAAAALENAAAHKVLETHMHGNAGAMREAFVIGRELERGNYSRMAGSVSILAGRLGLLELAFTPVGAAAAVAVAGIAALSLPLAEAERHCRLLEESTKDLTAILSGMDELESTNKLMDDFAAKTDDATDATKELESATEALDDTTKDALEGQRQAATYAKEEAEARLKLAEAQIRQKVASGDMTPAQGKAAEAALHEKAGDETAKAQSKAEQDEIDTLKGQRIAEQGIQAGLDKNKLPAEGKKQQADYAATGAEAELELRKKELKTAQDFWDKNHAQIEKPSALAGNTAGTIGLAGAAERTKEVEQNVARYQGHLTQLALLVQQAEDDVAKKKAIAKAEDDAHAKIISGLNESAKKITDLNREIDSKTTAHTAADAHRSTLGNLARQTTAADQQAAQDAPLTKAVNSFDHAQSAGGLEAAANKILDTLNIQHSFIGDLVAGLQDLQAKHATTAQQIAAVKGWAQNVQANGQ